VCTNDSAIITSRIGRLQSAFPGNVPVFAVKGRFLPVL
jgi:hypothetical protein